MGYRPRKNNKKTRKGNPDPVYLFLDRGAAKRIIPLLVDLYSLEYVKDVRNPVYGRVDENGKIKVPPSLILVYTDPTDPGARELHEKLTSIEKKIEGYYAQVAALDPRKRYFVVCHGKPGEGTRMTELVKGGPVYREPPQENTEIGTRYELILPPDAFLEEPEKKDERVLEWFWREVKSIAESLANR